MKTFTKTVFGATAFALAAQAQAQTVIEDSVAIGTTNAAFYSLANGEQSNIINNDWDIAFETSAQGSAIRINGQAGAELYEYPLGDTADWATVDITDIANWEQSYDSDQSWSRGAFDYNVSQDPFDLGWGTYSLITHTVTGDRVFVIKLVNGDYQKIWIKSLASGTFTFRHASIDNSMDMTHTIVKSDYAGKNFAYYSLSGHQALDREPVNTSWDLQFSKYIGDLGGGTWYGVSGILSNKGVYVSQAAGVDVETAQPEMFEYDSFNISVIGSDWKSYDFGTNSYLIEEDLCYFVEDLAGDIWKVIPTGFVGGSTGKFYFTKQLMTTTGIASTEESLKVAMFPNPAANGQTTLVYDQENAVAVARLFDMSGREVATRSFNGQGFQQRTLELNDLKSGIYLLRLQDGNASFTERLIIQ